MKCPECGSLTVKASCGDGRFCTNCLWIGVARISWESAETYFRRLSRRDAHFDPENR